jgi:GNAT superfamily N-acetyltransferase
MPVEISRFDASSASDTDFAEHYEVTTTVIGLDYPDQSLPTLEEYVTQMCLPAGATRPRDRWVAREHGRIIGSAYAIYPELENRHLASVRIMVTPTRRRQGTGTALLRAILPVVRARGRTVVIGEGVSSAGLAEPLKSCLSSTRVLAPPSWTRRSGIRRSSSRTGHPNAFAPTKPTSGLGTSRTASWWPCTNRVGR